MEGRGPWIAEVTLLCKQRLEEEDCRSRQGGTVRDGIECLRSLNWIDHEKGAEMCYLMRQTKGNNKVE